MSPAEIALIITAIGGGSGLTALIGAIRSNVPRRARIESGALANLLADRDAAHDRADQMEQRYDRMTAERNRWRERSHLQDLWVKRHCCPPGDDYPPRPDEIGN